VVIDRSVCNLIPQLYLPGPSFCQNSRILIGGRPLIELGLFDADFGCRIKAWFYGCACASTAFQHETAQIHQMTAAPIEVGKHGRQGNRIWSGECRSYPALVAAVLVQTQDLCGRGKIA